MLDEMTVYSNARNRGICLGKERRRKAYLVRVGHEGADLAEAAGAALEGTAVLAVDPRLGDNNTSLAVIDGGADQVALRSSPDARVVDAKRSTELRVEGAGVEAAADGDAVGDGPRLGDGDVDSVVSGADDDGRHLHVPVDEPLLGVDGVRDVVAAVALVQACPVAVVAGELLAGLDVVPVDLGGLGRHALELQEKFVGGLGDDGGYTTRVDELVGKGTRCENDQ